MWSVCWGDPSAVCRYNLLRLAISSFTLGIPVSFIYLFARDVQIRFETLSRGKTKVNSLYGKVKIFIRMVCSRVIEIWECYSINRASVLINRVPPKIQRNLSRGVIHPLRGNFVGKFVKL